MLSQLGDLKFQHAHPWVFPNFRVDRLGQGDGCALDHFGQ